jgi:hypothetical protein
LQSFIQADSAFQNHLISNADKLRLERVKTGSASQRAKWKATKTLD